MIAEIPQARIAAARRWFGGLWLVSTTCSAAASREAGCPWEEAKGKVVRRGRGRGRGGCGARVTSRSRQAGLASSGTHTSTEGKAEIESQVSNPVLHLSLPPQVAHPPGYPLFTLLSHLAMRLLPWISPAHSANLMSSLLGSAACGALCMCVCR